MVMTHLFTELEDLFIAHAEASDISKEKELKGKIIAKLLGIEADGISKGLKQAEEIKEASEEVPMFI